MKWIAHLAACVVAVAVVAQTPAPRRVVFVCEHGSVKSLIAREWFNRLASRRGLEVRAVSRGVTPDSAVPGAIADALGAEGFDVAGFEPRAFGADDAEGALRVVGIGVDLERSPARGDAPLETWDGIPAATEGYGGARDALRARVEALLDALERDERRP